MATTLTMNDLIVGKTYKWTLQSSANVIGIYRGRTSKLDDGYYFYVKTVSKNGEGFSSAYNEREIGTIKAV